MSEALERAAAKLREKLGGQPIDGSVKFEVEEGGAIVISGADVSVSDADADVTVTGSLETFQAMFDGDLAPTAAYMTGKVKVEGDMGMAMKLSQFL